MGRDEREHRLTPTRALVLLVACGLAVSACGGPTAPEPGAAEPETLRRLGQGDIIGFRGRYGAHAWRGIPFAQPPVGDLRWRAPRAPEPWDGVREALTFGSACPQLAMPPGGWDGAGAGEPTGAEDCLTLNVFAPAFAPEAIPRGSERLPVMFWIHGGGNSVGDALLYEGGNLAVSERVVVVTVHYRLGPLGWFRHASLRGEGTSAEDRSGNYGTLDLIQALAWVRDNVSAFGGDPNRVTIFGESAGGTNVYTLLLSPLARGLFQRAVVQSGGLRSHTPAEAENRCDDPQPGHCTGSSGEILRKLRAESGKESTAASPAEVARFLRAVPARELVQAYDSYGGTGMLDMPEVFRDGFVLPEDPFREVLAEGRYNQVPVVLGSNRDENKLFMSFDPRYVRTFFRLPLWRRDAAAYDRISRYRSDLWKALGVDGPASSMRRAQGPTVWAYRFDWDEPARILWFDSAALLGAAHAMEIPFVFGNFELGRIGGRLWDESNAAGRVPLSRAMMSYWAALAHDGNPGRGRRGEQPPWQAWGVDGETYLLLDSESGGGIRMADGRESVPSLVERIVADPGFADDAERCALLLEMAERALELSRERVEAMPICVASGVSGTG